MKVVLSRGLAGFCLSDKAEEELMNRGVVFNHYTEIDRANPHLVEMAETWSTEDMCDWDSELEVVEVPDGTKYYIEEDAHSYEYLYKVRPS